ncbi:MAG: aldo/keto reductase, partial [Candidatus Omnitrophica bacterium]|nr:aldo/keto reductase [Candidatus Omnitrophota bacterium]
QMKEYLRAFAYISTQNAYSLLDRNIEEGVLSCAVENQMGVLAYGPLAGGILTGKYQKQPHFQGGDVRKFFYPFYNQETFPKMKKSVDQLSFIHKPKNEIAINWVRAHEGICSVLVGARNAKQVTANIQASQWALNQNQLDTINEIFQGGR